MDLENKGKILIVDDDPDIRTLVIRKLSRSGYVCDEAQDGYEALRKVVEDGYDLIIADIKMPKLNGIEMLKQLKEMEIDIPVIMLTVLRDPGTLRVAMREGAYDYLFKPIDFEDMEMAIKRAVHASRLIKKNKEYQKNLEKKVEEQAKIIRSFYIDAIRALANALEARDEYTKGHSSRVSEIAVGIGKELGLSKEELSQLELAGLLHDIGKIGIKDIILNKAGPLSKEEMDEVKKHPEIGENILKPIIKDDIILKAIRHHHERYDGKGYPDGLRGEEIPLFARILTLADAFDAMNSKRPYREALRIEKILQEIMENSGTQFDPVVVRAFLKMLEKREKEYISSEAVTPSSP